MSGSRVLRWLAAAYWLAYGAALVYFACRTSIDYFDAFEYLRNARTLGGHSLGYSSVRPPLLPLIHAPLQRLLEAAGAGDWARLRIPHLLHAGMELGCLAAFYALLRRSFTSGWAQLGAVLLSLDRLMVHYSFCVLADIPCALFLLLAVRYAADPGRGPAAFGKAASALSALLLARWNMAIVPAIFVARALLIDRAKARRVAAAAACAAAVAVAVNVLAIRAAGAPSNTEAARVLVGVIASGAVNQFQTEPPAPAFDYARFLAAGSGLPVLALFLVGTAACWRSPSETACRLQAGLFASVAAVMAFAVGHKEARYLIAVLPALYFVALSGLLVLERWARLRIAPAAARILVAAVLGFCLTRGALEWRIWNDPIFRDPLLLDTARAARQLTPQSGRWIWSGKAFTLLPDTAGFAAGDPMFYAYHVPSRASVEYLLGRASVNIAGPQDFRDGDLIVAAPARLASTQKPLTPQERRLTLLLVDGTALRPAFDLRPK